MDKKTLKSLVGLGKTIRSISKDLCISQTTVRYWLKKHDLLTTAVIKRKSPNRFCSHCKTEKPKSNFYKKATGHSHFCKSCVNLISTARIRTTKEQTAMSLGGKCSICGYNKCMDALEFHHRDPEDKQFEVTELQRRNIDDIDFLSELKKCDLICVNCHRETHEQITRLSRSRKISSGTTRNKNGHKKCTRCNLFHPLSEFFGRAKGSDGLSRECKSCNYQRKTDNTKIIKQNFVDYKGGKCTRCSYNKCLSALEFHHMDPSQKEVKLSRVQNKSTMHEFYPELDKCLLVCSNCHREIHHEMNSKHFAQMEIIEIPR